MPRRWVVNASPLIALAKIGQIALLHDLCEEMVIPAGVAEEIGRSPVENDLAKVWVRSQGKQYVKDIGRVHSVISAWDLGLGESEVLSWGNGHPGWEVILDDRVARNCAASLGIKVRGTIGIILMAKKEGRIDSASRFLDQLRQAGFRVDPQLIREAKRLAGEV